MLIYKCTVKHPRATITFELKAHNNEHAKRRAIDYLPQVLGITISGLALEVEAERVAA